MPEFTVKEVRLPELHLPEVKRDEIVRALSGIKVPEVDRAMAEPRRRLRNVDLRTLPWRQRAMTGVDAGKLIAAALTAARIARPASRRSRWSPFGRSRWAAVSRSRDNLVAVVRPAPRRSRRRVMAVVIALAAAAGWMLFRNPGFRARLDGAVSKARLRMDGMRSGGMPDIDLETGEPVAQTTAEVAPSGEIEDAATRAADVAHVTDGTDVTEGAGNPA
jgi:hypothetical protein